MDWERYPVSQPGCGSRSLEPGIYERLVAEAEGSPLRARRIEVGSADDIDEFMFDQGFTDGLPVMAPSPERVLRMLGGTSRDAQEVVAIVPPNMGEATIEKIAINAVLAGCKPEYLPVVIAAVEAVCTDQFNAHGVMATTMGASPAVIVNGPIRDRIGMNSGLGALGQGNRAKRDDWARRAARTAERRRGEARRHRALDAGIVGEVHVSRSPNAKSTVPGNPSTSSTVTTSRTAWSRYSPRRRGRWCASTRRHVRPKRSQAASRCRYRRSRTRDRGPARSLW